MRAYCPAQWVKDLTKAGKTQALTSNKRRGTSRVVGKLISGKGRSKKVPDHFCDLGSNRPRRFKLHQFEALWCSQTGNRHPVASSVPSCEVATAIITQLANCVS